VYKWRYEYSRIGGRHLGYLSLPVRSDSIVGINVGLLDPKNIGLVIGIALLSRVQMEI